MEKRDRLIVFCTSLFLGLIFWRGVVFFRAGEVSLLRAATGFNLHHYHYGIFMVLVAFLIFTFYRVEKYSLFIGGFGFGSFFDGISSRLVGKTSRAIEISNYNGAIYPTILLFFIIVTLSFCFYLFYKDKI